MDAYLLLEPLTRADAFFGQTNGQARLDLLEIVAANMQEITHVRFFVSTLDLHDTAHQSARLWNGRSDLTLWAVLPFKYFLAYA